MKQKLRDQETGIKIVACTIVFMIGYPMLAGTVSRWMGMGPEAAVFVFVFLPIFIIGGLLVSR